MPPSAPASPPRSAKSASTAGSATPPTPEVVRVPTGHGGWRPGAGRKPDPNRRDPVHRTRAEVGPGQVVHIVLRSLPDVGRLREPDGYLALRHALGIVYARTDFRVVHASLQANHLHLLCEADDRRALSRGVQALSSTFARVLNRSLGRRGTVFEHRYFATVLTEPAQVRAALAYVLNNWRKHGEDRADADARHMQVDPYSSGPSFDGWRDLVLPLQLPADHEPLPTALATAPVLVTGWRRHPLLSVHERPETQPR